MKLHSVAMQDIRPITRRAVAAMADVLAVFTETAVGCSRKTRDELRNRLLGREPNLCYGSVTVSIVLGREAGHARCH